MTRINRSSEKNGGRIVRSHHATVDDVQAMTPGREAGPFGPTTPDPAQPCPGGVLEHPRRPATCSNCCREPGGVSTRLPVLVVLAFDRDARCNLSRALGMLPDVGAVDYEYEVNPERSPQAPRATRLRGSIRDRENEAVSPWPA